MKITKTALALTRFLLMIGAISVVEAGIKTHGEVLGVGTDALLGGDLTDPEDDGLPDEDTNYNAKFTASDEPAFGGGESAFNVFDNLLGGGNDKWCCGPGGIAEGEVISVTAEFEEAYVLSHFTVSSANDAPGRDPIKWEIHGSNDGENFTPIYSRDGENLFTERLQVILFEAGKVDGFDVQTTGYKFFRFVTMKTENWPDGAYFQLGELEYFGTKVADATAVDPKSKLTTTWGSLKTQR